MFHVEDITYNLALSPILMTFQTSLQDVVFTPPPYLKRLYCQTGMVYNLHKMHFFMCFSI